MHICNSKSTTELYGWKILSPSPWFLLAHQSSRPHSLCCPLPDWSPLFIPAESQLPFFFHFLLFSSFLSRNPHSLISSALHPSFVEVSSASAFGNQPLTRSHVSLTCGAVWRCYRDFPSSCTTFQHSLREHFSKQGSGLPLKKAASSGDGILITIFSKEGNKGCWVLGVRANNGLNNLWASSLIRTCL